MREGTRRAGALASVALLAVAGAWGCKGKARWFEGTVGEACARAKEKGTLAVVDVTAGWCPACNELEREFWNTRRGQDASERFVAVRVDFDTEVGKSIVTRHNVIHLPTTLVLDTDGHELGRIVGFEGAREYRDRLDELSKRPAPELEVLEERLAKRPDDLATMLALGEAYLQAGLQKKGVTMLNRVRDRDPDNAAGVYMDATRVLGRYFVRCGVDYYQGEKLFEEAVRKFPDAEESWELRSWIAQARWDAGVEADAKQYLADLVEEHPDAAEAHETRARFLQLHGQDLDVALEEIRKAEKLAPGDHWNYFVEAEILEAQGKRTEALAALEKAIDKADHEVAIFENRLEEWGG